MREQRQAGAAVTALHGGCWPAKQQISSRSFFVLVPEVNRSEINTRSALSRYQAFEPAVAHCTHDYSKINS
jgi:hypothetical protein